MGTGSGRFEILSDQMALARHVAEWMTLAALAAKGPFRVSLSGGSTPKTLYQLLASDEFSGRFPWQRVFWYWGDERFVPHDHPDSNYRMVREAMLTKASVPAENIYPIPTDGSPQDAAGRYERPCKRHTAGRYSIRPVRSSTSPCLALVPTAIRLRCCLEIQCWRSVSDGWRPSRTGAPRPASP